MCAVSAGSRMGPELQIIHRHGAVSRPAHGRDGGAVRDRGAGDHLPADAGRLPGAQRPRPDELGQHEHVRAHRGAAVHVHGRYPERQRPEQPHLQRARQARGAAARRAVADQHRGLRDLRLGQRLEHRDRGLDRRRRAAAAHQPQLQPRARGRIARGRRHARHSHSAELPDDHLRHVHRDLGAEAVHRRRDPRPDHDRLVHALHRRCTRIYDPSVAPKEQGAQEHPRGAARDRRHRAVLRADRRHARRALFRRRHHDRGRRDRLLPVDPARLRVRRPDLAQADRGDALDGEFLRQHPVPDLRGLRVLLRDQLRGHRREADRIHRRHAALDVPVLSRCCSCCSRCSAA